MKYFFLTALIISLGLVLIGCSSSTDSEIANADVDDFGDLQATDDEPYFGDPDIAEMAATEEVEYDDPILTDAAAAAVVEETEEAEYPEIYRLRIAWGNLALDSGIVNLTDWSGKLTISRGAIVVTHTILFETGQDYLLPRYNDEGYYIPEELGWVSQTSCHFDGLVTKLFVPPSDVTDEVVTVTYESAQYSISFTLDELVEMDTLITIGTGKAISFRSMLWEPGNRKVGGMWGRWTVDEAGQGIFYGVWTNAVGTYIGTVDGTWGIDSEGNKSFVGKWIDMDGNFQGFVKGYYRFSRGDNANNSASGFYWGVIYDADYEPLGLMKGNFMTGTHKKAGYFAGRWCAECLGNQFTISSQESF